MNLLGPQSVTYLDNNATTPVAPEVAEAMIPYVRDFFGNASSAYRFGNQISGVLEQAREQVASLIGADEREIVFTSCGTESDNAALNHALLSHPSKKHIVTSRVEHSAIKKHCEFLEKQGYEITRLEVDSNGLLTVDDVARALRPETALVTLMWANNETGVLFPVEAIGELCRKQGVLFHTDAVQAVGKIPINLAASKIDMLSISGHKLHCPKGVGVLYVHKRIAFKPYLIGGGQEKGRRGGTENTASIVALGKACELAAQRLEEENTRVRALRDHMEKGLLAAIPDSHINGAGAARLPNTTNVSLEGVEAEAVLLLLDREGICASSGSACTTGSLEPSHVLTAMGLPASRAKGSIRLSLSTYNTEAEVGKLLEVLPPIVARLRNPSQVAPEN
ncbi:MAG: cysteine desulfurase NifS [Verrucomicrobiae bacterium]|nr:cysteine desulfurase NifS [Verrucomicrobiae bacterium]